MYRHAGVATRSLGLRKDFASIGNQVSSSGPGTHLTEQEEQARLAWWR